MTAHAHAPAADPHHAAPAAGHSPAATTTTHAAPIPPVPSPTHDIEMSGNIEHHTAIAADNALRRISWYSGETANAIGNLFRNTVTVGGLLNRIRWTSGNYRSKLLSIVADNPDSTSANRKKAMTDAARLAIPDDALARKRRAALPWLDTATSDEFSKLFAENGTSELNIQTAMAFTFDTQYAAQIKPALTRMKESTTPSPAGGDFILKVYEIYFGMQGLPTSEAKSAAEELYAQNSLTQRVWNDAQSVMNDQRAFGRQSTIAELPRQKIGQLVSGSPATFICNIAKSPAIGLNKNLAERRYGPGGMFDGTRRLGFLWHKRDARPGWGAMDFEQLMTSYYALRKAVNDGDIPNNSYFRSQRDTIALLLVQKHIRKLAAYFNSREDQQEMIMKKIHELLLDNPPSSANATINSSLSYAKQNTAYLRKGIVGGVSNVVGGAYKHGIKKPVTLAATAVTYPFRKVTGWAQSFWKWGNTVNGGAASGHDAHDEGHH